MVRKEATFAFCTDEGAVAPSDNVTLKAYAKTLDEEPFTQVRILMYLAPENMSSVGID